MVKVPECWIVKKDRLWLMTSRKEDLTKPKSHLWSANTYDAERFCRIHDAKRMAVATGGCVWKFTPATGKAELSVPALPEGAKCDTCRTYIPYDGGCRNPESEFYRTTVSMNDVCADWRGKDNGRQGQKD